jgi:hypothetical protein
LRGNTLFFTNSEFLLLAVEFGQVHDLLWEYPYSDLPRYPTISHVIRPITTLPLRHFGIDGRFVRENVPQQQQRGAFENVGRSHFRGQREDAHQSRYRPGLRADFVQTGFGI